MLHQVLQLDRPLIVFDLETTGPNPKVDRIVEMGFEVYTSEGMTKSWQGFINPKCEIPQGATDTHGITNEMIQTWCHVCEQPVDHPLHQGVTLQLPDRLVEPHDFHPLFTFADLAPSLLRGFVGCDFAGYNIRSFDLPLLKEEFKREGHAWSYDDACLVDAQRIWQLGSPRTLGDAVEEFLQRKVVGGHRALVDVANTRDVIAAQLQRWPHLPRSVKTLHELQFPANPNAIDKAGHIIWANGVATMNVGKNWRGVPMTKMSRKDLLWIADKAEAFSDEVKQICRDAAAGRFPQPKLPMESV